MHPYVRVLQAYMNALGPSDYRTVKSLFTPGGRVKSPFLGDMPARAFFDRLAGASAKNVTRSERRQETSTSCEPYVHVRTRQSARHPAARRICHA